MRKLLYAIGNSGQGAAGPLVAPRVGGTIPDATVVLMPDKWGCERLSWRKHG